MVELAITLTFQTPLHIGAGAQQSTLAQQAMLKDRDGWPYVPASALKGRWRHAVEQIARPMAWPRPVCATHHKMCRQEPVCIVCQLFGSPWSPGTLRFVDLALTGPPALVARRTDSHYQPRTVTRTGVALNRRRQVAEDQHLYSTELFWPGVPLIFSGTVSGEMTAAEAGLLVAGLRLLPAMGKGKTAGLGWMQATAVVQSGSTVWTDDMLHNALSGGTTS